jgi:hypothetical protein
MITVVNIRTAPPNAIYIGREMPGLPVSPLGNPFRPADLQNADGRSLCIRNYRRWIWDQIKTRGPAFAELQRLAEIARTQDLVLACWCAPKSCHGDVVKAAIEWMINSERKGMRLIIAGGRNYRFTEGDFKNLDKLNRYAGIEQVVSGGATGADAEGERWARSRGVSVITYPADWETYGRAAGPIRNKLMAQNAEAVALFPGGRGTANMEQEARAVGLEIFDYR